MDIYAVLIGRDENKNTYTQAMTLQEDKVFNVRDCPDCVALELFFPEYKIWLYYDSATIAREMAISIMNVTYHNGSLSELLADAD